QSTPFVEVPQAFSGYDGVERLGSIWQGFGVGADDLNARRRGRISHRSLRAHGGDPRLEDVHRHDVETGVLGQREGESPMAAADVEHSRTRRLTRGDNAGREEWLPREILTRTVVGELDGRVGRA